MKCGTVLYEDVCGQYLGWWLCMDSHQLVGGDLMVYHHLFATGG